MAKNRITFDQYYEAIYQDRWDTLKKAMLAKESKEEYSDRLLKPYVMDRASVIAAQALGVNPGDTVLDLCAAPGGKTLVLASALNGEGLLISNDRSPDRRLRLKKVIDEYLPEQLKKIVTVTGYDASRWGLYEPDRYDKILLDAPCSSESHVLKSPHHLSIWSPARTKNLSFDQYALLVSALTALKPGGRLVYSTCSISPLENDEVIRKLIHKKTGFEILGTHSVDAEKTDFGRIFLPDHPPGYGPLFICLIEKKET